MTNDRKMSSDKSLPNEPTSASRNKLLAILVTNLFGHCYSVAHCTAFRITSRRTAVNFRLFIAWLFSWMMWERWDALHRVCLGHRKPQWRHCVQPTWDRTVIDPANRDHNWTHTVLTFRKTAAKTLATIINNEPFNGHSWSRAPRQMVPQKNIHSLTAGLCGYCIINY